MKASTHDIFREQPHLGEGEEKYFNTHLANWQTVNSWLQTKPSIEALKKAALFEALENRRAQILDRLTAKIFKEEKKLAMDRLMMLER